ncbi:hypothetical protein ElyMa_003051400 [Elysia marginata]|uniref:Uncharacterized protein n=1 Tax=Elysia marginata TaxID=1093978 RepID=A0AAV4IM70_9GAST|nr:hypothetical protein ElyMa_003051400 [Elysia marginata]
MPDSEFPTVLENIHSSMLQESQLAFYKLAGNQQRTTLVLRFDAMADTVAGTEDFIVEYCIRKEQINFFFTIEDKERTPYKTMQKRHIRDWPDDTHRIKEEVGPELIDNFLTELKLLKHSIQDDAARYC